MNKLNSDHVVRFGMTGINTNDSSYLVFGNFFKHLPDTHLDVAFGLVGLAFLYAVRYLTTYLGKKYPRYDKIWFFANIMRNGVLVIFGTLIAYLVHIGKSESPISILKDVPSGFRALGVPKVELGLLSEVAGTLPSVVIILILEHVAIAKSFGRRNNYKINPDQEIIAIGVANVIGVFFGMPEHVLSCVVSTAHNGIFPIRCLSQHWVLFQNGHHGSQWCSNTAGWRILWNGGPSLSVRLDACILLHPGRHPGSCDYSCRF